MDLLLLRSLEAACAPSTDRLPNHLDTSHLDLPTIGLMNEKTVRFSIEKYGGEKYCFTMKPLTDIGLILSYLLGEAAFIVVLGPWLWPIAIDMALGTIHIIRHKTFHGLSSSLRQEL